jgi:hypothetical protein
MLIIIIIDTNCKKKKWIYAIFSIISAIVDQSLTLIILDGIAVIYPNKVKFCKGNLKLSDTN